MVASDPNRCAGTEKPGWQLNLEDAVLLDPLVLLHGNVKDVFLLPPFLRQRLPNHLQAEGYVTLDVWLALYFEQLGYPLVILYDNIDYAVALRAHMAQLLKSRGLGNSVEAESSHLTTASKPELTKSTNTASSANGDWMIRVDSNQQPIDFFRTLYQSILPASKDPVAVISRFSDRYLSFTNRQDANERLLSLAVQKAALAVPQSASDELQSRIVMMFDLEGQIPQELESLAPFATTVRIPAPTLEEREAFFKANAGSFYSEPNDRFDPLADTNHLRTLANLSDGLHMQDLLSLRTLSRKASKGLGKNHARELFNRFRFGDRRNPWEAVTQDRLASSVEKLREDVKGQDEVIEAIVPILKSAKLSMGNVGASATGGPRGVLFFVGPTGVGKTELTKALVRLIFERDEALLRFDMSEFQHEHQQARLIGAPPGYVGFDQGGQLTNAVLEEPFRVILFDEIEKAYERIWDNFLQILDDGRLTDGRGRTVYFSDSLIIFTSNLGTTLDRRMSPDAKRKLITRLVDDPSLRDSAHSHKLLLTISDNSSEDERSAAVDQLLLNEENIPASLVYDALSTMSYAQLSEHFRKCVGHFFRNHIGRPEILGRLGEGNIHVFRFITEERTQREVIAKELNNLRRQLHKHRIGLEATENFISLLRTHPEGFLRNGVRGVKNLLKRFVEGRIVSLRFDHPERFKDPVVFLCDYIDRLAGIKEKKHFTPEAVSRSFSAENLTVEPHESRDTYRWNSRIDESGGFTDEPL